MISMMPHHDAVRFDDIRQRLIDRQPPPVPVAAIPPASVPALEQQRVLTDQDVWRLAAQATIANPGINLDGANLAGGKFGGIALNRPWMDGAVAPYAVFDGGTLSGCYNPMSLHPIHQVCASNGSFVGTTFDEIYFEACCFSFANMSGALFRSNTVFAFCAFEYASWKETQFQGTMQAGTVSVTDSTFQGSIFNGWVITPTAGNPVYFNRCNFNGVQFTNCNFSDGMVFNTCDFTGAMYANSALTGAKFLHCTHPPTPALLGV